MDLIGPLHDQLGRHPGGPGVAPSGSAVLDLDRDLLDVGHRFSSLARFYSSATTGLRSTPIPSISTSTTSPGLIGPTPLGVPVMMMSPGSKVNAFESSETR